MSDFPPVLLQINGLQKSFRGPDGTRQRIVNVPAFTLAAGRQRALAGESGSGKSTFLNLIAGILPVDAGAIHFNGVNIAAFGESRRDAFRAQNLGCIFQTFNLLQGYTCLENILLGMTFGRGVDRVRAVNLLQRVGLGDRLHLRPHQLSTGQQQRVAVARALANLPKLVLADEPTGNLDRKNSLAALALIRETCREQGTTLLLVSHDRGVLDQFADVQDFHQINPVPATEAAV